MNTEVKSAMGTPKRIAPPVTYILATIMGKIPNISLEGLHIVPKRNLKGPIFPIAGTPLANKKIHIKNTARTDAQAAIRNTAFMPFSFM